MGDLMTNKPRLEKKYSFDYNPNSIDDRTELFDRISGEADNLAAMLNEDRTSEVWMKVRYNANKGKCFVKVFVRD